MRAIRTIWLCTLPALLVACAEEEPTRTATEPVVDPGQVVEVEARHDHVADRHLFEIDSHEFASGWTTFRFINASPYDHFFLIWRVPDEGIEAAAAAGEPLLEHWLENVAGSFDAFYPYLEGEIDYETFVDELVGNVMENAPWFLDPGARPMGGPGFTAPGRTAETTVHLEPGEYIVECYVRDENDVFHTAAGMIDHLTVTEEAAGTSAPESTARLTISSSEGIQGAQDLNAGHHIVEIHFEDQATYAHLLGHNVQLVRLHDNQYEALVADLAHWMDWTQDGGLVDRAPEGASFLGGVMEMEEGAKGYLHVELAPGDHAWIAEVPDPAAHDMLRTFTVR